jgi:hypothetical protein
LSTEITSSSVRVMTTVASARNHRLTSSADRSRSRRAPAAR